jgi:diketogulonate reductase-like aldo/keto reductase
MEELIDVPGGGRVATDQVLYNLRRRGIEVDLLPWCRQHRLPIMAYSPIDEGRLIRRQRALSVVARRHGVMPAQVALRWVVRQPGVIAIPKAGTPDHVRENRAALDLLLTNQDLAELDAAFPPPTEPIPLEVI